MTIRPRENQIGRLLKSPGHHVQAFGEPEAFLRHLAFNPVSLVVLDIWMKRMNGMELLAHLCVKSSQTKMIFITGVRDAAAERTVQQAGTFAKAVGIGPVS